MMKRFLLIFLVLLLGCSANSGTEAEGDTAVTEGEVLVLGDISDEAAETIKGTQPIADYLAEQLADDGVVGGEVKIAPDLDTMIEWMKNGEVDLYFDSPYPVLVISQETGATPILSRLKYGVDEYHSVFFVREDSDITSLDDLVGSTIGFEEAFSTSGFMLPLSFLVENNFNPVLVDTPDTAVADNEIGYAFSTADDSTIQWVISGIVPAGVIDNVTLSRLPEDIQAQLRVIAETEDVPRQMVLVRPDMDPELVAKLSSELLTMDENEAGQAALEIFLTTEFTEFPDGSEVVLRRMNELYNLVQTP